MAWEDVWDLSGLTETQRKITAEALDACTFDWRKVLPGLKADVNKTKIPVEWKDLSRYARAGQKSAEEHDHDDHPHDSENGHIHVKADDGDVGHGILYRKQVLGLAWYSGKVTIHSGLESRPALAKETFICEGAHMADFFGMTPAQRAAIFAAYQQENPSEVDADDGWFEEKGDEDYWDWAGEAFMIGFTKAFTPITPTLDSFTHKSTPAVVAEIRRSLQQDAQPYFTNKYKKIFHDAHRGIGRAYTFATRDEALAAGLRPCGVCRP